MITFWIALLRAVGTVLFLFGVVGGAARMAAFSSTFRALDALYLYTLPVIESLVLVVICFGAASALSAQRRMEARIARATSSRRRSSPAQFLDREDLARVAPNVVMAYDGNGRPYVQSVQAQPGTPTVREAPPPVRVTPGTENQYIDTPAPPPAPPTDSRIHVPPRVPHKGGVDRELLRQARDTQIRQKQGELNRKPDTRS